MNVDQPIQGPFAEGLETAYFGMGCFWGAEKLFWEMPGVHTTAVGYAGGATPNPTYEEVCSGRTGHLEAVRVTYDPARISYRRLLDRFWRSIDPTDDGGQFVDRGSQYRTAVFVHDEEQRREAVRSKEEIEAGGRLDGPVVTEIREAEAFWPAEDHHQDYHETHPFRYRTYRAACGRPERLRELWGEEAVEA